MWWHRSERSQELDQVLAHFNSIQRAIRVAHSPDLTAADAWHSHGIAAALQTAIDALLDFPNTRLAAYGTLAPGQPNHAQLASLDGTWMDGTVEGARFMAHGYPAFIWRVGEERVPVRVLTSAALPAHWARLDEFEGADYCRILVPVSLPDGTNLVAYLYEYVAQGTVVP